jgi:hypothetical protein
MTSYSGTHPANIAAMMREIAEACEGNVAPRRKNGKILRELADDVERLGRAAGIKFLGDA